MRLENKTAIVTGAASGIGAASARRFAAEGADVTIADINPLGEHVVDEIRAAGGKAAFVLTDVADFAAIQRLFDAHMDRCGKLDVLFNNAGKEGSGKSVAETPVEELDMLLTVNFKSVFLACKLAGPIMAAAGRLSNCAGLSSRKLWRHGSRQC